ncbi:hypothetical protein K504DRAFT_461491 [Pleomassaria siparia CBS 279.74]|uniref:Uncharacterized protein n=1 Tax=Pleomassaria siparia CBS 279.74 TaxID=1314801 RepID=A0A6G1KJ27_9PLEO|nr:hypothetical protein K504DRAFT_461491 [Pleomassaria siparia CBS 279.74]
MVGIHRLASGGGVLPRNLTTNSQDGVGSSMIPQIKAMPWQRRAVPRSDSIINLGADMTASNLRMREATLMWDEPRIFDMVFSAAVALLYAPARYKPSYTILTRWRPVGGGCGFCGSAQV